MYIIRIPLRSGVYYYVGVVILYRHVTKSILDRGCWGGHHPYIFFFREISLSLTNKNHPSIGGGTPAAIEISFVHLRLINNSVTNLR